MNKPYIIMHMVTSIDGKVTGNFLNKKEAIDGINEYYKIHSEYQADAFACGRVTMELSFTNYYYPDLSKYEEYNSKEDYIKLSPCKRFAVCFDTKGKLGWKSNIIIDEDPGYNNSLVLEVLSYNVDKRYLSYLRDLKIPYIFAGEEKIDVELAINKLYKLFNIRTLLLEGGSIINGSFLKKDLIDEISLVYVPLIADNNDKLLCFMPSLKAFKLTKLQQLTNSFYVLLRK